LVAFNCARKRACGSLGFGMRSLIVNADDCNLTSGVTRAILDCHARGIVSSTTWLVNLPAKPDEVTAVRDSGLGVGLHLNVSLGAPLSNLSDIRSLVTEEGLFKKRNDYVLRVPTAADLVKEYIKQIVKFEKVFGRLPTHLDTHHQLHDETVFMQALAHVAREKKLPVRRSALMSSPDFSRHYPGMLTTQSLFGNLDAKAFWTAEKLEGIIKALLPGTAEVMCHPGIWDADLQKLSSMTVPREKEHELFSSPHLKSVLEKHKIRLIHFGNLKVN